MTPAMAAAVCTDAQALKRLHSVLASPNVDLSLVCPSGGTAAEWAEGEDGCARAAAALRQTVRDPGWCRG